MIGRDLKHLFYIAFALMFITCSSNDDGNANNSEDPFVGKWFFGPEVYKLDNGQDYTFPLGECQDQGWFIFNSNGTGELFDSEENPEGGCVIVPPNGSFQWEKLSENQYRFIGFSNETIEVIFENENTMYWKDTFGDGFEIEGEPYSERWSYFYK